MPKDKSSTDRELSDEADVWVRDDEDPRDLQAPPGSPPEKEEKPQKPGEGA
jgi:hypothetical protein